MPTAPTAFAQVAKFSKSPEVLRLRVLALYRQFIRRSPSFVEMYEMNVPTAFMRTKLREAFEKNRFVTDMNVRNILYIRGTQEFQETVNFWKQGCHVHHFVGEYNPTKIEKKPDDFVRRFIKGTA